MRFKLFLDWEKIELGISIQVAFNNTPRKLKNHDTITPKDKEKWAQLCPDTPRDEIRNLLTMVWESCNRI